jgi:hypothetical protein
MSVGQKSKLQQSEKECGQKVYFSLAGLKRIKKGSKKLSKSCQIVAKKLSKSLKILKRVGEGDL